MVNATQFIELCQQYGLSLFTGVPCSYLTPLINGVLNNTDTRYVYAGNEGDAVAIASGASLAGVGGVVMMQNSGLGNAVNPLTSLNHTFAIPVLLIVTLRGDPDGLADEPQHQLMGAISTQMLETMKIKWRYFPTEVAELATVMDNAANYMQKHQQPFALVMRKGTVTPETLIPQELRKPLSKLSTQVNVESALLPQRHEILRLIQDYSSSRDIIVATTGYTSRELYALNDRANQLYMVGSLGCAASLGLGIALAQPQRRVIVIDADGSVLMRLGVLAAVGYERPNNLLHILLDNHVSESTGGQANVSHSINFLQIAAACGYQRLLQQPTAVVWQTLLAEPTSSLTFCYAKIRSGALQPLPRPSITPVQVANRIRQHLAAETLVAI